MNKFPPIDKRFMARALELAAHARGYTSPNPMVGAVIVHKGRIIGEGYHRRCGGPHAEVWAVRSVDESDRQLLPHSTIYVTLEPCSHYGKTPPCARMLVENGIGRVVIGCTDPNPRVSGRGIAILREAGIEVITDVMRCECLALNRPFIIAQTKGRPYVMLKWACSADGYLDKERRNDDPSLKFSTALTLQQMHRLRSQFDAIIVGSGTAIADNPSLSVRLFQGRSPRPVIIDRRGRVSAEAAILSREGAIYISSKERTDLPKPVTRLNVSTSAGPSEILEALKAQGISSVMVEGGASLLKAFIKSGLWDDARIEVSPLTLGADGRAHISIPSGPLSSTNLDGNTILHVENAL